MLLHAALAGAIFSTVSCTNDLLNQKSTSDLAAVDFWQTPDDATTALYGAYYSVRGTFSREHYFDGWGDMVVCRGNTSLSSTSFMGGEAYYDGSFNPSMTGSSFDRMFRFLYGGVNRANYVIVNTEKLIAVNSDPQVIQTLQAVIGESKVLRALCYFRLITMWGDVPYFTQVFPASRLAPELHRIPLTQVKDSILQDLTDAIAALPNQRPALGRMGKAAAYALRGKVNLYYASWTRSSWPWGTPTQTQIPVNGISGGWPEAGITPNDAASLAAYQAAAADFLYIIQNQALLGVGLFRGGLPGSPGTLGSADVLPNYFYMFTPRASDGGESGNESKETLLGFTHGGTGTSQSEQLAREFGGRSQFGSQNVMQPRLALAGRYQLISTGDFAPALVLPANTTTAITPARVTLGSSICPDSYAGRDFRMKATLLWDGEPTINVSTDGTLSSPEEVTYIYSTWDANFTTTFLINGSVQTLSGRSYRQDSGLTSYGFRKFIRNYPGQNREAGDMFYPLIRLADVYLMYAEAANFASGPMGDGGTAVSVVNQVRARAGLPALDGSKYGTQLDFFNAIEQERIVELLGEGTRGFDLHRWRRVEFVWNALNLINNQAPGIQPLNIWGTNAGDPIFRNTNIQTFQRQYICKYPQAEIDRAAVVNNIIPQTPVWN